MSVSPPRAELAVEDASEVSSERPSLRGLLSRRYRLPIEPKAGRLNALPALAPLLAHRSVRRYLPQAHPKGCLPGTEASLIG